MVTTANIFEIVAGIQAKKEQYRVQPTHALYTEIKAILDNIEDSDLQTMLDNETQRGLIQRVRVLNGFAYKVAE